MFTARAVPVMLPRSRVQDIDTPEDWDRAEAMFRIITEWDAMKVAFRADASSAIGLGHLMRCMALATELRRRGADVRFVCRRLPGDGAMMLDRAGIEVDWLPEPGRAPTGREPWNLVAPDVDAEQTLLALGEVDWLVMDHYGLDDRWESSMRARATRLLVIDDLPDRGHDADILLDQNLAAPDRGALLPPRARQLLGPHYALLGAEFATAHAERSFGDESEPRVLVYFGGGGHELTAAVAAGLTERFPSISVDVVVSGTSSCVDELFAPSRGRSRLTVHVDTDEMARLMWEATLMVGAAGSTTWERCATGLPAVTVSVAANQESIARAAARARVAVHMGTAPSVRPSAIVDMSARLLRHPDLLARMSHRALQICDGRGTARVARAMGL